MATDKTQRILDALTWADEDLPVEAFEEAESVRETLAPKLIRELEKIPSSPEAALESDYVLHLHAIALLAQWRDARAYAPLLALLQLPSEQLDALFGDYLSVVVGRALASVSGGDLDPIRALALDPAVDTYAREAALEALVVCAFEGDLDRETLVAELRALGEKEIAALPAKPDFGDEAQLMPTWVVSRLSDVADQELWPLVEAWFKAGYLDAEVLDSEECRAALFSSFEERRDEALSVGVGYITDAADAIAQWVLESAQANGDGDEGEVLHRADEGSFAREMPKVGRNDPCPCNSGKKYKKCCGREDGKPTTVQS